MPSKYPRGIPATYRATKAQIRSLLHIVQAYPQHMLSEQGVTGLSN